MKKLIITDAITMEFVQMVRKVKFFSSMSIGMLEKILNRVKIYQYDKEEKVCKQGDTGDSFYVVYRGKLNVLVKKGFFASPKQVAVLNSGDFFGEMSLLNRAPRNATVVCEEDSQLFVLLAEDFQQVAHSSPDFADEMKRLAAERGFEIKGS